MPCRTKVHRKQGIIRRQMHKDIENAQYGSVYAFYIEEAYVKRPAAREVLKILKALPPHTADHYITLMSIEKDLHEKKKGKRLVT